MAWIVRTLVALAMAGCAEEGDAPGACDDGALPGELDDLARTPREDRDAEHLALSLDPSAVVAAEEDYELVRDDLAAIRRAAPRLMDVGVGCGHPNAIEVWAFGPEQAVLGPAMDGTYTPFACLNERFGFAGGELVDGAHGIAFALDGVYSSAIVQAYRDAATEAGLGADVSLDATWLLPGEFPGSCGRPQRTSVAALFDGEGAAVERTYTFELDAEAAETWRVVEGATPMLLE